MKTLKELNSKWYWRLVKTIYVGSFIVLLWWIYYSVFNENEILTYSKNDIQTIERLAKEEQKKIEAVKNKFQQTDEWSILYREDLIKLNVSPEEITILLALGRHIWGLDYEETWYSMKNYWGDCDEKITKYLKTTYAENEPMQDIILRKCGINWLKALQDYTGWYNPNIFYYFLWSNGYTTEISYSLVFWNIIYCIGYLLWFILITVILRGVAYYIILGSFSPPK